MLSVIIKESPEPTVLELTVENLQKELHMKGSEVFVSKRWSDGVKNASNDYICLVESDCLISSGYFASQMGLFMKNRYYRQLVVMASATAVNDWASRFYGYSLEKEWHEPARVGNTKITTSEYKARPNRVKGSKSPYPIETVYIPGAIIRKNALLDVMKNTDVLDSEDLVKMSIEISQKFGKSNRHLQINPNTTYVTTEEVDHG